MNQEDVLTKILTKLDTIESDMVSMKNDMANVKDDISGIKNDITLLKSDMSEVKEDVQSTRQIVARMEIEHGQKLGALFDADTRNYDKITKDITPLLEKHDDDIEKLKIHVSGLRRVK